MGKGLRAALNLHAQDQAKTHSLQVNGDLLCDWGPLHLESVTGAHMWPLKPKFSPVVFLISLLVGSFSCHSAKEERSCESFLSCRGNFMNFIYLPFLP